MRVEVQSSVVVSKFLVQAKTERVSQGVFKMDCLP